MLSDIAEDLAQPRFSCISKQSAVFVVLRGIAACMPCCARAYFPALVRPRRGEDQRSVEVPGNCVTSQASPQSNKTIHLALRRRQSSEVQLTFMLENSHQRYEYA